MTPRDALIIASDHAAHSAHGQTTAEIRRRRRDTMKIALRRLRDEPSRLARKYSAKAAIRQAQEHTKDTGRTSRVGKAALLFTAGAASIAASAGTVGTAQELHNVFRGAPMHAEMPDVRRHAALLAASDELKQALVQEEGVRYTVYRDVAGYPTVGIGHLVTPQDSLRVGDTISHERAMAFLDADIRHAEEGARALVGDLFVHQHEFDALVDLVYNVGIGNVSERESPRLNAAIDAGDYRAIADELSYEYAGGAKAGGLENRSERRASIFLEANYEDPRTV